MSAVAMQLRLLTVPIVGLMPMEVEAANALLVEWGHRLGTVNRPFRSEAFALELDGRIIAVAISASTVSATVAEYRRQEVVELARLASDPTQRWATRVMLRLWREACAPRWECWPVRAAISYSKNALHPGDIYRFDGWRKVREDAGGTGGGTYSTKREAGDPLLGPKTLWVWDYTPSLSRRGRVES
jgi:hypothetical protein